MTELEQLRRRVKNRYSKAVNLLRKEITELLPMIDDLETLQVIYANVLAAFYDEGKDAECYLKELGLDHLHTISDGKS